MRSNEIRSSGIDHLCELADDLRLRTLRLSGNKFGVEVILLYDTSAIKLAFTSISYVTLVQTSYSQEFRAKFISQGVKMKFLSIA